MKRFWERILHAFSCRQLEGLVIPQADIDRLETARIDLWKLIENEPVEKQAWFVNVTGAMWILTHKRYKSAV